MGSWHPHYCENDVTLSCKYDKHMTTNQFRQPIEMFYILCENKVSWDNEQWWHWSPPSRTCHTGKANSVPRLWGGNFKRVPTRTERHYKLRYWNTNTWLSKCSMEPPTEKDTLRIDNIQRATRFVKNDFRIYMKRAEE